MAISGLSENWLLKFFGDTHWLLLSKGFNTKSSAFRDDNGNRLYAAFVRIKYSISPLNHFNENETIEFNSSIEGFGGNTYLSTIQGKCDSKHIQSTVMTTFSIRENENNNQIIKSFPNQKENKIKQLSSTPLFLNEYRRLRKGLLDEISTDFGLFSSCKDDLFNYEYEINPYYDINGVGLLYFASYPIIADKGLLKYDIKSIAYQTIYRDIFYLGNCNANDKIHFVLNSIEEIRNRLKIISSLFRKSDNEIIAKIFTIKEKNIGESLLK